ncbi:D-glycero-beta-D-manno-heptose 1-phosphate adenylyltransferase [candidate division KSB1 bacterium]|nr:D-glycero-beta-D-manno-heptose 1-phosphate adenylyltransferase [candidate division KSB1 bacterium]
MELFEQLVQNFGARSILVIGDLSLEEYIVGQMTNIATEGPVPVVEMLGKNYYPGGAGHVAATLQALGFQVHLVGLVGHDTNGKILLDKLIRRRLNIDGVFIHEGLIHNTHIRITVNSPHRPDHEILRIDTPDGVAITSEWRQRLMQVIQGKLAAVAAVVVIDKKSTLIDHTFCQAILKLARQAGKLTIGDSDLHREFFKNYEVLVCNDRELSATTGLPIQNEADIEFAGQKLRRQQEHTHLIVTRGAEGMSIISRETQTIHLATSSQEVYDVTGAGETVTATLTAALVSDATIVQAARLANYAAGIAIRKSGLVMVSQSELLKQIRKESAHLDAEKVVLLEELKAITVRAQQTGKVVVWTNGCFDLMHFGHILYLKYARSQGDLLIVGLNSDASISRLKGPTRPIVEESQRAKILAVLPFVDYVVIFSDTTPLEIIQFLRPDVYVKGGDYTIDTINQDERRLVEGYGGKIAIMPGVDGMSTTHLIKKIIGTAESAGKK